MRPISMLKLPEEGRQKLYSLGYEYIEDIEGALSNPDEQLKELVDKYKITERMASHCTIMTVADLLKVEAANPPVAVFHQGLDKLLDGGLPIGRITELYGPSGSGKTQMCLQFCADVQMPTALGGTGAEALYITTSFGFTVNRMEEILNGSVQHCLGVKFRSKKERAAILKNFTVENLLNGVKVVQANQLDTLLDAIRNLKGILDDNRKVKLLIIDSFCLPFILEIDDFSERSTIVAEMMDLILDNAIKYKLAVVLTNQVMWVVSKGKIVVRPCLGEGFAHRVHQRLQLNERKIYLMKSINHPLLFTEFEITKDGIR